MLAVFSIVFLTITCSLVFFHSPLGAMMAILSPRTFVVLFSGTLRMWRVSTTNPCSVSIGRYPSSWHKAATCFMTSSVMCDTFSFPKQLMLMWTLLSMLLMLQSVYLAEANPVSPPPFLVSSNCRWRSAMISLSFDTSSWTSDIFPFTSDTSSFTSVMTSFPLHFCWCEERPLAVLNTFWHPWHLNRPVDASRGTGDARVNSDFIRSSRVVFSKTVSHGFLFLRCLTTTFLMFEENPHRLQLYSIGYISWSACV